MARPKRSPEKRGAPRHNITLTQESNTDINWLVSIGYAASRSAVIRKAVKEATRVALVVRGFTTAVGGSIADEIAKRVD